MVCGFILEGNKMKLIKFNTAGKWADSDTLVPQIEVEEGDEVEVSDSLAALIIENKRGEEVVKEAEKTPAKVDKKKAEKNPAKKDKKVAEKE